MRYPFLPLFQPVHSNDFFWVHLDVVCWYLCLAALTKRKENCFYFHLHCYGNQNTMSTLGYNFTPKSGKNIPISTGLRSLCPCTKGRSGQYVYLISIPSSPYPLTKRALESVMHISADRTWRRTNFHLEYMLAAQGHEQAGRNFCTVQLWLEICVCWYFDGDESGIMLLCESSY